MNNKIIFDEELATKEIFKALGIWDEIVKEYYYCIDLGMDYAKILFKKAVIDLVNHSDHRPADQSEDGNEAQK